jgi:hypothetical protein
MFSILLECTLFHQDLARNILIVFHTCVHGPLASLFVVVISQLHVLELLEETCSVHEVDHVEGGLRVRYDLS